LKAIPFDSAATRSPSPQVWSWICAAALGVWFGSGAFPVAPVEGDELAFLHAIGNEPPSATLFRAKGYIYDAQPGSYWLIDVIHAATALDPLVVFGVASLCGACAFLLLSSTLVAGVTEVQTPLVVLALLLTMQEFTAAGAYANTTALGAPWTLAGMMLLRRPAGWQRYVLAPTLIALGGWLRLDTLLIAPAVLLLPSRTSPQGWAWVRVVTVAGALSGVILALLFLLSDARLGTPLQLAIQRPQAETMVHALTSAAPLLTSFTTAWILPLAIAVLALHRAFGVILTLAVGLAPSMILHAASLTSTKYLYATLPFLAIPVLWLMRWTQVAPRNACKRWCAVAIVLSIGVENITGFRTSTPEFRNLDPSPTFFSLAGVRMAGKIRSWVAGPGEILGHADGLRVRTGLLFAPTVWSREKARLLETERQLGDWLATHDHGAVLASTYLAWKVVDRELLARGFTAGEPRLESSDPTSCSVRWRRGAAEIEVVNVNKTPTARSIFSRRAAEFSNRPTIFVNDVGPATAREFLTDRHWKLWSATPRALLTLYVAQR